MFCLGAGSVMLFGQAFQEGDKSACIALVRSITPKAMSIILV